MSAESEAFKNFGRRMEGSDARQEVLRKLAELVSSVPPPPPRPPIESSPSLLTRFSRLTGGREKLLRAVAGAVFAAANGAEAFNDISAMVGEERLGAVEVLHELRQHVDEERRKKAQEGAQSSRKAA